MQVQGYEVVERLHAGRTTAVFRALRARDRKAVVLKMQHGDAATDPRWLRREFELTQKAEGPSVIGALALLNIDGAAAIAFEDPGGMSLDRVLRERRLSLQEALSLAIEVTRSLAWIHKRGLIHKDINPSNLLVSASLDSMRLIDFGLASTLQRETVEARSVRRLEGTLAYIAPEQTGRINRGVDSRADLYSFGVTLHEMLTGRLPYPSQDALELVHAHVALPAPSIEGVPPVLSGLVRRLMAKLPEDRYQTAEGVRHDLQKILDGLRGGGVVDFELGQGDVADKLVLPEKLYGREAPRASLLSAIERVSQGSAEWFGVKGPSGIGKSRLVAEVLKPLLKTRGYLGSGKHDQLHQQRPCAGVTAALGQCVRQILGEPPEMVEHFRERIRGELGAEARLVVDELPELGVLLGETAHVPSLSGQEAQNRFVAVMRRFVGALASREHPLVLFLDDLQWADATTFRLLSDFLTDPEAKYLLLIAAYRDDEVDGLHPLTRTVGELKAQGVRVDEHKLEPLSQRDTEQFLGDALRCGTGEVRPIAEILRQKTGGNPFFLGHLLRTLHEGGQIRLDLGRRCFAWDEAELRRIAVADNVVGLMTASLSKLPPRTLDVVRLASCLGAQFSLEELAARQPLDEAHERLGPALEAGYLEPVGEAYAGAAAQARYRFAHDRVQQAAYAMLSEEERLEAHLMLGRAMAQRAGGHPERAILAADHLNRALDRITDPGERKTLVELNKAAGERAGAAGVFDAAYRYLGAALDAMPSQQERAASFELLLDAAAAALLCGEREASSALVDEALAAAPSPHDKARALFTRVSALTTELPMSKALDCGLQALELLGVSIPRGTGKVGVMKAFGQLRLALRGIDWRVASLPSLQDPKLLLATRLLTRLQGVSFEVSPDLFMVAAFRLLLLSLEQGVSASTPPALGTVAIVLGPAFGDWSNALRCREQALSLLERPECAPSNGYCRYTFSYFIEPWVFPLHEAIPPLQESVRASMSAGDHEATGYLLFASLLHRVCVGEALDDIHADIPALQRRLRRVSPLVFEWLRAPFQAVENLRGEGAADPCALEGSCCTEESFQNLVKLNNRYGLALYRCQRVHLLALFQRHEEALAVAAEVDKSADVLLGQVYQLRAQAYAAMAGYALAAQAPLARRPALLAKAALRHRTVEGAARRAPFNFAQLAELLKAERALATGAPSAAIAAYERAIAAARDNRLPQDEALACERLGRLFLGRNSASTALPFLRSARLAYLRWGAKAKVKALDAEFPSIASVQHGTLDPTITTSSSLSAAEALDFRSLMKAAHAVSSELSLDTLLPRFARIALENAGAQRCQLFLSTDAGLVHVATAEGSEPSSRRSVPLEQAAGFARSAVAYVHRTGEQLLVADARSTTPWAGDPHVQKSNIRSILALPLRHQGHRVGVLYLEKDASAGDFPRERIELLELLSSQAGSAIEIAQLYASLEHKVEERTAALSASLKQVVETQRQLAGELADASHFVRSLLPEPLSGKVRTSWVFEPSTQLGGDALGYQWLDDQRLAVYLLDACGHGVKASLLSISVLSSSTTAGSRASTSPTPPPSSTASTAPSPRPTTAASSSPSGTASSTSPPARSASPAPATPALLLAPGAPPVELNSEGAIVGVIPDLAFPSQQEPFPPGSRLVVFSDGVYEIESPGGQMMRYEDFVSQVTRSREGSLSDIVAFARSVRGPRDLEDDVSLVEVIG